MSAINILIKRVPLSSEDMKIHDEFMLIKFVHYSHGVINTMIKQLPYFLFE